MEPVEPVSGYVVHDRESAEEILAIEAELLRSEGIDPTWPGFPEDHARDEDRVALATERRASIDVCRRSRLGLVPPV
jgi:hypothetical protein